MVSKSKVEVFFRANFQMENTTSDNIKQYIEEKLIGIKVKNIEVHTVKSKVKVLVTSNLVSVLTGSEEFTPEDYPRGTSFLNAIKQPDDNLVLEKIRKEFAELKVENEKLEKQVKEDKDLLELLQAQLHAVNEQLESIDMERCALEEKNETLQREVEKLRMKAELNEDRKSILKGPNEENIYMKLEAYEELLGQKQKQFADEKRILQDNVSTMTLRLLDEQEKVENIRAKANQVDEIQKRLEIIIEENAELLKDVKAKEKELEDKAKELVASNEEVQALSSSIDFSSKMIKEKEEQIEDLNDKNKKLAKKILNLEERKVASEKIEANEKEKIELIEKNSKLISDIEQITQHHQAEKSLLVGEKLSLQKILSEERQRIKELEGKLDEKERAIADLNEEGKRLEKLKEEEDKLKSSEINEQYNKEVEKNEIMKQDMAILEADRNYKEKELKLSEEKKEKAERELIVAKGKFRSLEKIIISKVEEIKQLKAKIIELEQPNNTKSTQMIVDLNKQIEELKEKYAMQEVKIAELEESSKTTSELETAKNRLKELQDINKTLQIAADDRNSAVDAFKSLQERHDMLLKENADLKAVIYTYETKTGFPQTEATSAHGEQKVQIVEEIRQLLAEVIYAYKTMATNAKQSILDIQNKQDKINEVLSKKEKVLKASKKEEVLELLRSMEKSLAFLKGITDRLYNLKLINNCLKEVSNKKIEKLTLYKEEIDKYKSIIDIAEDKIQEYEERLSYYY